MTPFFLDWPEFNAPFSLDAHDSEKADSRHAGHQTAPFTSCIYRGCKEACLVYKKKQDEEGGWIRKTESGKQSQHRCTEKKTKRKKTKNMEMYKTGCFTATAMEMWLRPNRSLMTPDVCVFSQLIVYVFARVRWIEIFSILMLFYILGSEE